jgi:hypothetical protein
VKPMRGLRLVVIPVLAGVLLAACGGGDDTGSSTPARTASASPISSPAGTGTAPSGPAVVDCGSFFLDQGEAVPDDAARCLIAAATNRTPARLLETKPTVEGDPIPITYVTETDGTVRVTTDATQDQFGPGGIAEKICTGPRFANGVFSFARCTASQH